MSKLISLIAAAALAFSGAAFAQNNSKTSSKKMNPAIGQKVDTGTPAKPAQPKTPTQKVVKVNKKNSSATPSLFQRAQ